MTSIAQKIPSGYKQTEIGVIPADWETIHAGDIGRFRGGNGFPTRFQGAVSGDYPFYKVSDMNNEGNDTFMFDSNNWISERVRKQINARVFPAGGIVFAKVGAAVFLERKKILTKASCIDNNLAALVLDNSRADIRFIHYVLHSVKFGALVSTTALPSLSGKILSQIILALPVLREQATIATALSDADALIEKLEQLIEKKKNIKQGAMQELLTGKRRLPGCSGEWEMKTLGQVLKIKHGKSQKNVVVVNGKYPILASGGEIGRTDEYLYNRPSVLIGRKGTIDVPQYMDKPFWTVDTLFYSEIEEENEEKFLFYRFQLIDWYLYNEASGVPSLNAKTIERIETNFPPTKFEQTSVVNVLSDLDAEIEKLEAQLTKYQNLKQGMMQSLLTGKIRLLSN